jgi:subtilisin family serine protease
MKYSFFTFVFLTLLLFPSAELMAQKRYWVFLADKSGVEFDPYSYFDAAAIYNRQVKQIPLVQFSDLPLREDYLNEIKQITGNLGTASRWINAVAVNADNKTLQKISKLPFVLDIQEIKIVSAETREDLDNAINFENDQLREAQISSFGVKYFENIGIDGSGVRIAVFDGGFPGVDTSSMFKHLRNSGRIIATWDFVKNEEYVYDYSSHGTRVLTCIAGILDNKKFGLAPGSEFLLARTEVTREIFSEEENWLAAVEWADKNGADIINSSLGYTYKRYFPHQMDGKSTLVTRSANMAASKGILVINAAGNDGDKKWEVIGAPADADSVLTIGGVSPDNGNHIDFSSYGPTFDGRMKPNLVAFGKVCSSNGKKIKQVYGTSFATPLITGFAACVMQIHPEWSNMETFRELEKSGHLFPYFDYAHGFGVPQAFYFTVGKPDVMPSVTFSEDDENLIITPVNNETIDYSVSDLNSGPEVKTVEIQQADTIAGLPEYIADEGLADSGDENLTESENESNSISAEGYKLDWNLLYFHIIPEGEKKIKRYAVVNMQFTDKFTIPGEDLNNGDSIHVYYKGYVSRYIYNGK